MNYFYMLVQTFAIWGCMPEITNGCIDMTNASSTYLSIAIGAVVGAVIGWWIYNLQKKAGIKQEETLKRINDLQESHKKILEFIQQFQQHQDRILHQTLDLDKKIDTQIEYKNKE